MLFGLVYSLSPIVKSIDVFIGHWDNFQSGGAEEFLQDMQVSLLIEKLELFWEKTSKYQLVIWTDLYGWHFQERRTSGPRGMA